MKHKGKDLITAMVREVMPELNEGELENVVRRVAVEIGRPAQQFYENAIPQSEYELLMYHIRNESPWLRSSILRPEWEHEKPEIRIVRGMRRMSDEFDRMLLRGLMAN